MDGGTETEIKLAASPAMLEQLSGHPLLAGVDSVEHLESTYFDTADRALARAGAALRLRRSEGTAEQTLKLPLVGGDALRRGEWTAPADGLAAPDPARFPEEPAAALAALLGDAVPLPVLVTRVSRTARRLRFGGSVIEADFDSGRIEADGRREEVCELELELVEGTLADLLALTIELPLGPELAWSLASKSARGHALAAGAPPTAVPARPVVLDPGVSLGEGLAAIARNCLDQALANSRLVVLHGLPEAVHQARIAIRRLRAALSLFRAGFEPAGRARFAASWKAAGHALGPARDAHVLLAGVAAAGEAADPDLRAHLERLRAVATHEAQAVLAGADFQRLLVSFAAWTENGVAAPDMAAQSFGKFAAKVLRRRRRRLANACGRLRNLDAEALHDLRIDVKKLRYGIESTESLFPDRMTEARACARDLRDLQDLLGEVNDMAVAATRRDSLFAGLEPGEAARLSAALAALHSSHHASRARLLRRAERKLSRIAEAPTWWKAR